MTQPTLREEMAGMSEALGGEVDLQRMRSTSFRWSQRFAGDAVVIRLDGEMDLATAPELRLLLRAAETDTAATIVLEMSEVGFIDASSIGVILEAWIAAGVRGRALEVRGLRGLPARVFRILGLESTFVPDSREDTQRDADG
jgi:anti-sigma B factor antagonist